MTKKFELTGWKELNDNLMRLEKLSTQKTTLRKALIKSGQDIAADASSRAPKGKTGRLKNSISVGPKLTKAQKRAHKDYKSKTGVEVFLGSNDRKAHLIEFGTAEHKAGGKFKGATIPAQAPRAFMRPAWEAGKDALIGTLGKEMATEIQKAIKRQDRRNAKKGK